MHDLLPAMESLLILLKNELSKEEDFCIPSQKKVDCLRSLLKTIYDISSSSTNRKFGPLSTLLVDGLDEESIWEELQTRTKPLARFVEKRTKLLDRKYQQKLKKKSLVAKKFDDNSDDTEESGRESDEEPLIRDDNNDEEIGDLQISETEEISSDEVDEEESRMSNNISTDFKDDVEMEAWLDAFEEMEYAHKEKMERKEKRAKASTVESREWEEDEEEEDDLEFVENALYASDEDDDIDPKSLKFDDFYVHERENKPKRNVQSAMVHGVEYEDDDDVNEEDDDDNDGEFNGEDDYQESEDENSVGNNIESQNDEGIFSSSYQRRSRELANQIAELEKDLMAEKSWELKGEVKGGVRPENSLLDVSADVERSTKVAPVITQEYTTTLEDKIIERIKAGRFDDPSSVNSLRHTITDDNENNADHELSQEKSKVGLGELYAEEFAKQLTSTQDALTVQTQALHEEAVNLFNEVARQLDALTHFFFTPKPVAAEASAKVLATQRSIPALEMEDITPYSQNSTALAVAPEQLLEKRRGKKVTLLTSEELTSEDRKKLRRHKKSVGKTKKLAEQNDAKNMRREAEKKLTQELKADKRVIIAGSDNKEKTHKDTNQFGKSSVFFSKLQEEAKEKVGKSDKGNHKRKRDSTPDVDNALKFKL